MSCATKSVKVTFIIFNVILALLAIGTICMVAFGSGTKDEAISISSYVACAIIVLFALVGLFAAIRESVCLTITSAVFLLILAVLQIISTILYLHDYQVQNGLHVVEEAWNKNNMDKIQQDFECCGKTSSQDYVVMELPVPPSCYIDLQSSNENLYVLGCTDKVQTHYENERLQYIIASWVLVAFELLCFVMAVFLAINFRNKQRRMQF